MAAVSSVNERHLRPQRDDRETVAFIQPANRGEVRCSRGREPLRPVFRILATATGYRSRSRSRGRIAIPMLNPGTASGTDGSDPVGMAEILACDSEFATTIVAPE